MDKFICEGDLAKCSQGSAPCRIKVVSNSKLLIGNKKAATVNDYTKSSLSCFGMCRSMANPKVAAATAAANGVLQPQPCEPVIATPWNSQSKVCSGPYKAITDSAKTACAFAGEITVTATQNKVKG